MIRRFDKHIFYGSLFQVYSLIFLISFLFYLLQLREIEWENSGFLLHDRRCDVACFLYDSSDPASFTQVVQLREVITIAWC